MYVCAVISTQPGEGRSHDSSSSSLAVAVPVYQACIWYLVRVLTAVQLVYRRIIHDIHTMDSIILQLVSCCRTKGSLSCSATIQSIRGQNSLETMSVITCRLQVAKCLWAPTRVQDRQSTVIVSRACSASIRFRFKSCPFRRKLQIMFFHNMQPFHARLRFS